MDLLRGYRARSAGKLQLGPLRKKTKRLKQTLSWFDSIETGFLYEGGTISPEADLIPHEVGLLLHETHLKPQKAS